MTYEEFKNLDPRHRIAGMSSTLSAMVKELKDLATLGCPYKVGERIRCPDSEGKPLGYGVVTVVDGTVRLLTYTGIGLEVGLQIGAQRILASGKPGATVVYVVDDISTDRETGGCWSAHLLLSQLWSWHDEDQGETVVIPKAYKLKDLTAGMKVRYQGRVCTVRKIANGRVFLVGERVYCKGDIWNTQDVGALPRQLFPVPEEVE